MNFTAELEHMVLRTFGDEVLQQSIRRKALCMAQLKSRQFMIRIICVRDVAIDGYAPEIGRQFWGHLIARFQEPFTADVEAAVLAAPSIVLKPTDYCRPKVVKTVRLCDDCRRTIFSFLETGTVLEMFKDFMHYIRLDGGEQNTSTWEARLGDRRVLLENTRGWYGRPNCAASRQRFIKVMILKASDSVEKKHFYGSGWGDIESIWTFNKIPFVESLFTAPEFDDIHAMVPSSYDRRVHNIVTNTWLWSAVHRRPALRRRNRLRAVMEADINIKIYY